MIAATRSRAAVKADFGRLEGVQCMRYIAALGVMLVHLQWKLKQYYDVTMVPAVSNTAIDLFFIISGFVVALAVRGQGTTPGHFFARRLLRIYPPYFVLTALAWLAFVLRPDQVNSSGGTTNVLASFLLWPGHYKFLIENAWTLPHEFAFYALATFALLFRWGRSLVLLGTIALTLGTEVLLGESVSRQFIMADFLTGILALQLSVWLAGRGVRIVQPVALLLPIGLAVIVYLSMLLPLTTSRLLGVNLLWCVCLIVVTLMDVGGCRNWVSIRLAALGDRSYSIYLVHPFTFKLMFMLLPSGEHGPLYLTVVVLAAIVISTVAGALFYRLVEVPLRALMPR